MVLGYNVNLEREIQVKPAWRLRAVSLAVVLIASLLLAACSRSEKAAAADAGLAQSLFEQNRFGEARIAINEAISEQDDEPQYHILRGRIEYALNAIPQAYDAYSNALALDPSNMEALQAVSQLGLQTGNLRESLDATETILSLAPNDLSALLTRGLHSIVRSRFDEANGYADKILSVDPANEGGAVLKARATFRKGEAGEALAALDRFSSAKPPTVGIALTRLEIYRALGNAEGMRTQFALLRGLAPDNDDLRVDEANFAFKDGRPADALATITSLLSNPKLTNSNRRSALDLWREYSPAGPSAPDLAGIAERASPATLAALAAYFTETGRVPAASLFSTKLDGTERVALEAGAALKKKDWRRALTLANRALSEDDTHCFALSVKSEVELHNGDTQASLRSAQESASQCPNQVWAWRLAATSYSRRGDPENAERMWRQGIDANRQNSLIVKEAADWLVANGKSREAIAIARRLTHDAPALLSGWRLYESLCSRGNAGCEQAAERGLSAATRRYGIDLLPGEPPPNGLFGRIITR